MGDPDAYATSGTNAVRSRVYPHVVDAILGKILIHVEDSLENTKNIDLVVVPDKIRYPIVAIEKNANIALGFGAIPVPYCREIGRDLSFPEDTGHLPSAGVTVGDTLPPFSLPVSEKVDTSGGNMPTRRTWSGYTLMTRSRTHAGRLTG